MTTAKNDITGDKIATKVSSQAFRDNFDAIFRNGQAAPKSAPEAEYTSVTNDEKDNHAGHSGNP